MSGYIDEDLNFYFNHLAENAGLHQASSDIENVIYAELKRQGFVFFNTPIIHHGIHEYDGPTAEVITGVPSLTRYFLRQSAQFEKQLIVMAGKKPYFQKSFCFRPGEDGKFHIPYHNQIDLELPFRLSQKTPDDAKETVLSVALGLIRESLMVGGKEIESVQRISYERSMEEFGNDSPFVAPTRKNGVRITIVENPPLFKNRSDIYETVIHPMAQPIMSAEEEKRFVSGEMTSEEMGRIKVYGYDVIASASDMFQSGEVMKGLEVSGGSVRIKNPDVQRRVVELTLKKYSDDYLPLIGLLTKLKDTDDYTAGAAVGLERLVMTTMGVTDVKKVLPLPWLNNIPPFAYRPS